MFQKLFELTEEYKKINEKLANTKIIKDYKLLKQFSKRKSDIQPVVERYQLYQKIEQEIEDAQTLMEDANEEPEMRELAGDEREDLLQQRNKLKEELQKLLIPVDPRDERNVILEIRAGTGGDEAALFAGDLMRMYAKYADVNRWKIEVMSEHSTGVGGYKEIVLSIAGKKVFSRLKYEGGVHRVQRVPQTEAQGRVHTSAVTVAVLPEAEDVDVQIDETNDLRIDVFRSSGPGGQSVNTTDSAVRITHIPTGIVISCQDEKSQHKNKSKGLKILRARLYEKALEEQQEKISQDRRKMVSTGDRSAKIRTYNFPQGRVTDHRIGMTIYRLDDFLNGDLDDMINALVAFFQAEALKVGSA